MGYHCADSCLKRMQSDYEAYLRGERIFDLSYYKTRETDIIPPNVRRI